MQRCSSHIASLTDLNEAEQIGAAAVECALNGNSGRMMSFRRISSEPYRIEIVSFDVSEAANKEK
jgi:6-phosphofructokinase